MLVTELRESIHMRSRQLVLFVAEFRRYASQIVPEIDAATAGFTPGQVVELGSLSSPQPFHGKRLIEAQNALVQVKNNVTNWPYGSLTSLAVREWLVTDYPHRYANAAAVQAEIVVTSGLFNDMNNALAALAVIGRARGQLYDIDLTTQMETAQVFAGAETNALRAVAVAIRDAA